MQTTITRADEALRKAQQGETLSTEDRWAIHRRLLHLRSAVDFGAVDDLQSSRDLIGQYNRALRNGS